MPSRLTNEEQHRARPPRLPRERVFEWVGCSAAVCRGRSSAGHAAQEPEQPGHCIGGALGVNCAFSAAAHGARAATLLRWAAAAHIPLAGAPITQPRKPGMSAEAPQVRGRAACLAAAVQRLRNVTNHYMDTESPRSEGRPPLAPLTQPAAAAAAACREARRRRRKQTASQAGSEWAACSATPSHGMTPPLT